VALSVVRRGGQYGRGGGRTARETGGGGARR
jgi:hypothetical protein